MSQHSQMARSLGRSFIRVTLTYVVCLLAIALFAPQLLAADTEFRLSWQPPVERMDGTPLDPATELASYELVCSDTVTEIPAVVTGDGYPVAKADALPGYGIHDCTLAAVDTEGRKSPPSEAVQVEWIAGPSAPTELIIFYGPD